MVQAINASTTGNKWPTNPFAGQGTTGTMQALIREIIITVGQAHTSSQWFTSRTLFLY